jgi:hypothetical protein
MEGSPYSPSPSGEPQAGAYTDVTSAFDIERGLRHGIAAFRRAPWVLLLGGFLKSCTEGGSASLPSTEDSSALQDLFEAGRQSGHSSLLGQPGHWAASDAFPSGALDMIGSLELGVLIGIVAVALVAVVIVFLLGAWIGAGWIRLHAELIRTGEATAGTLFSATDCFGTMVMWSLTSGLIGIAGVAVGAFPLAGLFFVEEDSATYLAVALGGMCWFTLVFVGLIYLRLCLSLTSHAIVLEGLPMMAAIERSFSLTSGGRLHLLIYMAVFSFISFLVTLPGYCLCLIGVLITRPIGLVMRDLPYTEGFLRLTQPPDVVGSYSINSWGGA